MISSPQIHSRLLSDFVRSLQITIKLPRFDNAVISRRFRAYHVKPTHRKIETLRNPNGLQRCLSLASAYSEFYAYPMKHLLRHTFLASAMVVLGACASTPDAAEICSAEWIAPRADKAVAKIEKRAGSTLKNLSSALVDLTAGKSPNFLELWTLNRSVTKLKKELTSGQGIRDLKTVATRCNDPQIVKDSMRSMMQRQGISNDLLTRIESNPIYQSVVSVITAPEPVAPKG